MPFFITAITAIGGRKICPVAFTDQAEAEMFAAVIAFANPGNNIDTAVEEMETPSGITPVPAAAGLGPVEKRKKGK